MSKSKENRPSEGFHQEYIASLRYRNDLPPPEMPPKFLDIPHEGLQRFLAPGFASNMARREEPGIDVDAEGGMPIDLVGIPGLHLGDESAILMPEHAPPPDPRDLPFLVPLDQLKNPSVKNANVSFLRRTQYIAAEHRGPGGFKPTAGKPKPRLAEKGKLANDDPLYIKKYIMKGFDIAYPHSKHTGEDTAERIKGHTPQKPELDAWAKPVHPENPKLKPVGFFPVLPDLQGYPDPGGFVQFKFDKPPLLAASGKRDERIDVGLLYPSAPSDEILQEHEAKTTLHKNNPKVYKDPGPIPWNYDLFVPDNKSSVTKIKESLDPLNPKRNSEELYTQDDGENKFHLYDRLRTYYTKAQQLNQDQKQRDIALTLFDPAKSTNIDRDTIKAAYYYPILGKMRLAPERARKIARAGLVPARAESTREDQADQIHVTVRDPDEAEIYKRSLHRGNVDPEFKKTLPSPPQELEADENEDEDADAEPEGLVQTREGASSPIAEVENRSGDESS
ncbi:Paf1-domain-containing protein [Talaromyces proteolyticus]|uniref:Paf1-domain-containing protein n=1 Tax=Talaromyces proteolyticus TaxID=1131652 RepID=A0AAD4KLY4_9EURO|nr:Paf1-domain-containing protein [Talaromyces proteolyticus]KAH8691200.1 Paf1-domain-containing protein [Talaromyces proteolyticus]